MGYRFRASKSFGPIRVTASRSGIGVSAGAGPLRVGRRADGRVTTTFRIPGSGISYTSLSSTAAIPPALAPLSSLPEDATHEEVQTAENETWRSILRPDGTPQARALQRNYVRAAVNRAAKRYRPSLKHLTVGHAEQILALLGCESAPLHQGGRGSAAMNRTVKVLSWAALVLWVLVLLPMSVWGWLIDAVILTVAVSARVRPPKAGMGRRELGDWGVHV
ncbi:DUF4236 domain-containing protein [Sinomonas humi]|uniref:DUF4236 domain-containing protein n=1 Tax=Sinomonas humi TaxID=1338436 RepID=A0A0B2AEH2_9MICC|nr:DUF4236 domain-containing protein [Sinomonas humi]KHL00228.1 hypothetical protein LK10_20670 [Sinomonas humi]